jgi:hypothetical protein
MILVHHYSIHLLTTKPYNMKTTIALLLFFNMSLLFAQNKITGTIAAKNNKEKLHLQLLLF